MPENERKRVELHNITRTGHGLWSYFMLHSGLKCLSHCFNKSNSILAICIALFFVLIQLTYIVQNECFSVPPVEGIMSIEEIAFSFNDFES